MVSEEFLSELFASIKANPKTEVKVDVPAQTVTNLATGKSEHFDLNGYKKYCLMNGLDDIDFLLESKDKIEDWEKASSLGVTLTTCSSRVITTSCRLTSTTTRATS